MATWLWTNAAIAHEVGLDAEADALFDRGLHFAFEEAFAAAAAPEATDPAFAFRDRLAELRAELLKGSLRTILERRGDRARAALEPRPGDERRFRTRPYVFQPVRARR
jgi:hypothetical protein